MTHRIITGDRRMAAFALAGLLVTTSALAQSGRSGQPAPADPKAAAPAARPVEAEPSLTTAAYGDWILRCIKRQDATPGRQCEIAQAVMIEGQSAPLAQLAIGRNQPKEPLRVITVLPNNVTLSTQIKVALNETDPKPLMLAWQRCLPGGCFAEASIGDDVLGKWRDAPAPLQVTFSDGAGRSLSIPVSVRGLTQALDALVKS